MERYCVGFGRAVCTFAMHYAFFNSYLWNLVVRCTMARLRLHTIMCCSNTLHNGDNTWLRIDFDVVGICYGTNRAGFGRVDCTFAKVHCWIRSCVWLLGVGDSENVLAIMARAIAIAHPSCAVQIHYIMATTHDSALILMLLEYICN